MSTQLVALRNTISGQAHEYPEAKARKILKHPVWGKVNEEVRTAKPEVLSDPYELDEQGNRKPIDEQPPVELEKADKPIKGDKK